MTDQPLLEVHLLGFNGDLYGREMQVEFVERVRDERKFESMASLAAEMERDKERARAILAVRGEFGFGELRQIL